MSDLSSDTDTPVPSDLSVQETTASRGAWLDKRSACQALGVVEKTIERRVARGEIPRQVVNGRVLFWIEGAESDMSIDTDTSEGPQDARSVTLAVVQQFGALVERIETLSAENGRLRAELEAARQRESVSVDVSDKHPWWWRLFGG